MAQNNETYNLKEIMTLSLVLLFAGVVRIPSLTQPIGPDQGIMAVIGEGILNGKLPYRDMWEMASPAIFFTYALMFKIFGPNMAAIPITDTLVSMLTTLLIYMLSRKLWGKKAGLVSALSFALLSSGVRLGMHAAGDIAFGTFWYISQRETFMLPLILAGIYLVLYPEREEKTIWNFIISGFLAGVAFVYKFPSLIFFAAILLYLNVSILSSGNRGHMKSLLVKNLSMVFGFLFGLAPFVLFFLSKGALQDMTDVIFKYVYSVYGQMKHDPVITLKIGVSRTFFIARESFIIWIFFIASSLHIVFNDRRKENLLMVLWGLAAVVFVISHREFFGYHYLMIFPPFSIMVGYGMTRIFESWTGFRRFYEVDARKTIVVLMILANLFVFTSYVHAHYTKFIFYMTGKIDKKTYYGFFSGYPEHDYSFPAIYEVSEYIKDNSTPDDMIYVLGGIESSLYFLTKRESPSRFIFSWIIFSDSHGRVKQAEEYRKELLADLSTKKPRYIVAVHSIEAFKEFKGIYNFVKNNYALEKEFPDDRFLYVHNMNVKN